MSRLFAAATAVAALFALTACDGGPASKPSRDQAEAGTGSGSPADTGVETASSAIDGEAPKTDPRTQPAKMLDGAPIWAANRRLTAEEAAQRQFTRNGADFGAKSVEDYARKARAFVAKPPSGAETITRRNGDRLIYDEKSNVFAVATKDGVPRTMFKPEEGPSYWQEAKVRAEQGPRRNREGREREDRG
jgi:pyocin large subunit-like protein